MDYLFKDKEHKNFFYKMVEKTHSEKDCYRKAFFYTLGIDWNIRDNIHTLYDFEENGIKPEGLKKGWQTDTTSGICKLAFNLYNGFIRKNDCQEYTPYSLFNCSDVLYMLEALKIRFADYIEEEKDIYELLEMNGFKRG